MPEDMSAQPTARTAQLVIQDAGDELVLYDERAHTAHALSPVAAAVWRACDGSRSPGLIARSTGLEADVVEQALEDLSERQLLELTEPAVISRRQATKRIAQLGGAAFAAPLIYSVAIGPAIAAASACGATGTTFSAGTGSGQYPCTTTAGGSTTTASGNYGFAPHCCAGGCANDNGTYYCAAATTGTCTAASSAGFPAGYSFSLAGCCSGTGTPVTGLPLGYKCK